MMITQDMNAEPKRDGTLTVSSLHSMTFRLSDSALPRLPDEPHSTTDTAAEMLDSENGEFLQATSPDAHFFETCSVPSPGRLSASFYHSAGW